MRVDLRGGDARVTQQFLHGAHVGPALDQMRGEGMAQCVRMQGLVDMRAFPAARMISHTDCLDSRLPRLLRNNARRSVGPFAFDSSCGRPFLRYLAIASHA